MASASSSRTVALFLALTLGACSSSGNGPKGGTPDASSPADGHGDGQGEAGGSGGAGGSVGGSGGAGHQGTDAGAGIGGNEGIDAKADCASAAFLPPILTVVDAITGAPICDPTFAFDLPDGGVGPNETPFSCGQSKEMDCPAAGSDGGLVACAFALFTTYDVTVEVSKVGYETASVAVMPGQTGCVAYRQSTHATVKLHPLADASTDGG
jgi:hypothetical protein